MAKMTSAYASKVIRKLNEDKEFYRNKEREGYIYVASLDEDPVIPDYNYAEVAGKIAEIDEQIVRIKHAINYNNAVNPIDVGNGKMMTIDMILIKMAQLSRRKEFLDIMRKTQPKVRLNSGAYNTKKTAPEYQYINFDPTLIQSEYDRIDRELASMQLALDHYNQTFEFEV